MQPKAFDGIEKRALFGEPVDQNAVLVEGEGGLSGARMRVGCVIHDQNQVLARVDVNQVFEKGAERLAVLVSGGERLDGAGMPVVRAKDVQKVRAARRGDEGALSAPCPAAAQRWVQTHCRFAHKEEFGRGDGLEWAVFLSQSTICAAVSCAGRSCR